jgi:hypothetical protein
VLCSAIAPKNIDAAVAERESISMDQDMIEAQVTGHRATPLSEEAVGYILQTGEVDVSVVRHKYAYHSLCPSGY